MPNIYLISRDIDFDSNPITTLGSYCNEGGKLATNVFGQDQNCDVELDRRRRIRSEVWAQNLGLYSSIGMRTKRQTKFLGIWWNAEAERLSVEGEGYYTTKWPSGILYTDYYYTRPGTRRDLPNEKNVNSPMPQAWHSAEIGYSDGKKKIKLTKPYEYKKHESDHAGWYNGTQHKRKVKHI
jgi:hypothetical protein